MRIGIMNQLLYLPQNARRSLIRALPQFVQRLFDLGVFLP